MNPLVVPVTSVKFKSAFRMCNKQWIFYENFLVFGQIENLGIDLVSKKTFTSNSGKLSWQKFRNWIASEFTAHYACKNAHRDESTTTNGFNFRIIKTLMVYCEVRLTWLHSNQRSYAWIFGWTLRKDVRLACVQTPGLFFDLHVPVMIHRISQK